MPCAEELIELCAAERLCILDWMLPAELVECAGQCRIAGVACGADDARGRRLRPCRMLTRQWCEEDGYSYDWYNDWTDRAVGGGGAGCKRGRVTTCSEAVPCKGRC